MAKSKFDIELPQCIIDSYARHLVSEMRKFYAAEGANEHISLIGFRDENGMISKRGNEVFNGRESILKSQNR